MTTALAISAFVAAAAASAAVFYSARQYRHATEEARLGRTLNHVTRYNDPQVASHVMRAEEFLWLDADAGEAEQNKRWHEYHNDPNLKTSVVIALNFFDGIGAMYTRDLLDKKIVESLLAEVSRDYWAFSEWFIARRRQSDPSCWRHWEKMNNELSRRLPVA